MADAAAPQPVSERDLFEADDLTPAEAQAVATSELRGSLGWIAFGIAVLIGSITMDRLRNQDINPYTVPGLLPGLLGVLAIVLGVLMLWRSWRRGGALAGGERLPIEGAVAR